MIDAEIVSKDRGYKRESFIRFKNITFVLGRSENKILINLITQCVKRVNTLNMKHVKATYLFANNFAHISHIYFKVSTMKYKNIK